MEMNFDTSFGAILMLRRIMDEFIQLIQSHPLCSLTKDEEQAFNQI